MELMAGLIELLTACLGFAVMGAVVKKILRNYRM